MAHSFQGIGWALAWLAALLMGTVDVAGQEVLRPVTSFESEADAFKPIDCKPNRVKFTEYDAIRWAVAEHAIRLHEVLAGRSAPPNTFRPRPVKQRFRVLATKDDTDNPSSGSRSVVAIVELAVAPKIDAAPFSTSRGR